LLLLQLLLLPLLLFDWCLWKPVVVCLLYHFRLSLL
jgi:hypothetical protein